MIKIEDSTLRYSLDKGGVSQENKSTMNLSNTNPIIRDRVYTQESAHKGAQSR
jgi:hypothetical protein